MRYKRPVSRPQEAATPHVEADRRRSLRTPLIIQQVRAERDRHTFFGHAKDISRGGLFISATNPKEIGSRFNLDIPLPEPLDRTVRCTCEVVWRRVWSSGSRLAPGMGIRFLDLPDADSEAVDRWVCESQRRVKSWPQ